MGDAKELPMDDIKTGIDRLRDLTEVEVTGSIFGKACWGMRHQILAAIELAEAQLGKTNILKEASLLAAYRQAKAEGEKG